MHRLIPRKAGIVLGNQEEIRSDHYRAAKLDAALRPQVRVAPGGARRAAFPGAGAAELVIDTGRRPDEICALPWDCLEYDEPGHLSVIRHVSRASRLMQDPSASRHPEARNAIPSLLRPADLRFLARLMQFPRVQSDTPASS